MVGVRAVPLVCGLLVGLVLARPAGAASFAVAEGESIQAAIDAAADGDRIDVGPGLFAEDLDFRGKAIAVVGAGPATLLRGTGAGPVVVLASGEPPEALLAGFTITGGSALRGGGIFVGGSDPTIARNVIRENRASLQGSGIFVTASAARIHNNLIVYNGTSGGDPHSLEVVDAAPEIVNNTIARGDSNGIILRGISPAVLRNNILAANGSGAFSGRRGRGICDFSGGRASIHYNLFFRNRVAALLTDGTDFRRIGRAERAIGPPRLVGNLDGRPPFARALPRDPARAELAYFVLRDTGRSRARDAGDPDPAYDDRDGTRNDLGFTGGPLGWMP